MKRLLFNLIFIFSLLSVSAASPAQRLGHMTNEIFQYLKSSHCAPQYINDSKMWFTYGSDVYTLNVSQSEIDPFYITISSTYNLDGEYDPRLVTNAIRQIESLKMVKPSNTIATITFQSEMYVFDLKSFKTVLPKVMQALVGAKEYFNNYYEELASQQASTDPSDSLPLIISPVDTHASIIHSDAPTLQVRGDLISTRSHDWECLSIQLDTNRTILTKRVMPKSRNSKIFSNYLEYIEDVDTGKKYYLDESEIGFENNPTIITDGTTRIFNEVYPMLPAHVKRINICGGGDSYYVKGMIIRQ